MSSVFHYEGDPKILKAAWLFIICTILFFVDGILLPNIFFFVAVAVEGISLYYVNCYLNQLRKRQKLLYIKTKYYALLVLYVLLGIGIVLFAITSKSSLAIDGFVGVGILTILGWHYASYKEELAHNSLIIVLNTRYTGKKKQD